MTFNTDKEDIILMEWMLANFEQFIQRIEDMGGQNINSTSFIYCAVEFRTNIFSAVKTVWLFINFLPSPLI